MDGVIVRRNCCSDSCLLGKKVDFSDAVVNKFSKQTLRNHTLTYCLLKMFRKAVCRWLFIRKKVDFNDAVVNKFTIQMLFN